MRRLISLLLTRITTSEAFASVTFAARWRAPIASELLIIGKQASDSFYFYDACIC